MDDDSMATVWRMCGTWTVDGWSIDGRTKETAMAERIESFDAAKKVADAHIVAEGMDQDAVWSWLVLDEDYEDGCTFTEEEIRKEVDAAWTIELRARKLRPTIEFVGRRHGLTEAAITDIARNVALNTGTV